MTDTLQRSAPSGEVVLSLRGISKHFGAVSALTDIDLDVHAGEVVASSVITARESRRW